jgi:2-oxo-4-hydroxy-4-carboxy-5-ureidoimidazoline decarboxylase
MTLDQLNRLSEADATAAFTQCCTSSRWVERMVIDRPFESLAEMLEISDRIWEECDVDDYLEAFQGHPRIGDVESLAKKYANTKTWAGGEQKGVEVADRALLERLAQGNADYEEKFGHIFIVCATGKSAAEMFALLEARMPNDPKTEVIVAAEEQNKITRIRLKKLLA